MKKITLAIIAGIALILIGGGTPAEATKTTDPATTVEITIRETTVPEECVPEGTEIVDVDTGDTYIYGTPTLVGFDTCGNLIPDICVEWPDRGFTTLWTAMDCTPVENTEPQVEVEASIPTTAKSHYPPHCNPCDPVDTTSTTTVVTTTTAPTLADTGNNAGYSATIGGLTLLAGLAVYLVARRKVGVA